jgi:hypothetical protein
MHKQKSKIFFGILFIAALVSFLPLSAQAATVYLGSFQSGSDITGEIYGGTSQSQPVYFCIDPVPTVVVPGTYTYTPQQLSGSGLQAAWLMNYYAPALRGPYGSYTYDETGLGVQLAIWHVLGFSTKTSSSTNVNSLASYLESIVPAATGLTYLSGPGGSGPYYALMYGPSGSNPPALTQPLIGGPLSGTPVPIPPTVWLLGSGLLGLVGLRRKFRK